MDKNGVLTSADSEITSQKPIAITVTEKGTINCVLVLEKSHEYDDGNYMEQYDIYPIGVDSEPFYNSGIGEEISPDNSKIRILYSWSDENWGSTISYEKAP